MLTKNNTWILLLVLVLFSSKSSSRVFDLPYGMQADISGYLGWKQIFSDVEFDSVHSEPEVGLLANLKFTDRLSFFNQFKYGTNLDSVLVYSHLSYVPDIPIDDFVLTLKGGKIWYDWGMYNRTRVNPRTRKGVFQPQSMYWNTLDQTITSGTGIGADIKYKNFSASYLIDNSTIENSNRNATAWLLVNTAQGLTNKFGDHQILSAQYEIPDYGLRFTGFWNTFSFKATLAPLAPVAPYSGEHLGIGVEWVYNDFTTSFEGMCGKRGGWTWTPFSRLFCGLSSTIEYDISDNFSVRANYNQYRTPFSPANQIQTYTKDMNLGFGWHNDNWIANVEAHYIQGGRLVQSDNFVADPGDYKQFWVIGTNLVYFWN